MQLTDVNELVKRLRVVAKELKDPPELFPEYDAEDHVSLAADALETQAAEIAGLYDADSRRVKDINELMEEIARLREAIDKSLSDAMVAAGMTPLEDMSKPNALTKFAVHSGMTDTAFFLTWLERKSKEYRRMQAAHQTGEHVLEDDMFDFILGKGGAFSEVLENYRAALREGGAG